MRILTKENISSLLRDLDERNTRSLLGTLSAALATYTKQQRLKDAEKTLHQPLRTVMTTNKGHTTLVMPVSDTNHTAVKAVTVPAKGDIQGAITLYNDVGQLEGVLDASEITAFRTALATMTVLSQWKAPEWPHIVVFGAGKQAEWHIRLSLLLLGHVQCFTVINRSAARLAKFRQDVLPRLDHKPVYDLRSSDEMKGRADLAGILKDADIIFCCTPSTAPLFSSDQLRSRGKSRHFISLIGSYKPVMQEVDTETIQQAGSALYVDSRSACLEEAGELIRAGIRPEDVTEAGELFTDGTKKELDQDAPLTIFKCVGFALMDLSISQALLKMANEKDIGLPLAF